MYLFVFLEKQASEVAKGKRAGPVPQGSVKGSRINDTAKKPTEPSLTGTHSKILI